MRPSLLPGKGLPDGAVSHRHTDPEGAVRHIILKPALLAILLAGPALTGADLDAVVSEGANRFFGISFDLSDPAAAFAEARREAVADGRARAELFAEAAGVTLGPLVTLDDVESSVQPLMMPEARYAETASPVPVSQGEVTYTAGVRMVFRITD